MKDDDRRLSVLLSYGILDTPADAEFDDLAELARRVCNAPVALITFLAADRQWFKAAAGIDLHETPLDESVCIHQTDDEPILVISNLAEDPRTSRSLLARDPHNFRFYAGAPLRSPEGAHLGSICVLDTRVRPEGLSAEARQSLLTVARATSNLLELRRVTGAGGASLESLHAAHEAARKAEEMRRSALLELGDELRMAATAEVAIVGASRLVGQTLSASRAGYAEADDQAGLMNVRAGWTDEAARPIVGQYPFDLTPATIETLQSGDAVAAADVAAEPGLSRDAGTYSVIDVAALLAVPVRDEQDRLGAVFVHDRTARQWSSGEIDFVGAVADRLQGAVAKLDADQDQRLLNRELSHRLKNTLAVVQAMAAQTLRAHCDPAVLDAFAGRLGALSKAHDVLLQQRWSAARIVSIVRAVVGAVADLDRFVLDGPDMNLAARVVMTLSLLLHELATNALKYGALSVERGLVDLSWRIDELGANPIFRLRWEEKGGPPAAEPQRRGFGSRLIQAGLVGVGNAEVAFRPSGLLAEFRAPLAYVSAG